MTNDEWFVTRHARLPLPSLDVFNSSFPHAGRAWFLENLSQVGKKWSQFFRNLSQSVWGGRGLEKSCRGFRKTCRAFFPPGRGSGETCRGFQKSCRGLRQTGRGFPESGRAFSKTCRGSGKSGRGFWKTCRSFSKSTTGGGPKTGDFALSVRPVAIFAQKTEVVPLWRS